MIQKYETTAKVTISCDGDVVNLHDVLQVLERKKGGTLNSVFIRVTLDDLDFSLINSDFPDVDSAGHADAI